MRAGSASVPTGRSRAAPSSAWWSPPAPRPMTLTLDEIRRLPKAELHIHLDGCLRPTTMIALARTAKVALPATNAADLGRWMLVDDARDLEDYLKRFEVTIALLQTPEAIERV